MRELVKRLRPTVRESKKIKEVVALHKKGIKIPKTVVRIGGSIAKGTFLRGSHDIDLYVMFDKKTYEKKDISNILERALKKFNPVRVHGSRDYFQLKKEGYLIEFIPILKIRSPKEAKNITDISPFHVKWVKKHNRKDEVRLTKAFMKASGCYGAESYIKGFSGYVAEILTITYGSFENLTRQAANWSYNVEIGKKEDIKNLNKAKASSPIILIDPVDIERNAAAALSKERFNHFRKKSKAYQKRDSLRFFEQEKFSIKKIKRKYNKKSLILLEAHPLERKKDIAGAKLLKALEYLRKRLEEYGLVVWASSWHWDEIAYLWLVTPKENISRVYRHFGPEEIQKQRSEEFKKKHMNEKIYNENGRLYIKRKRRWVASKDYIDAIINDDNHIRKFVKEIKRKR